MLKDGSLGVLNENWLSEFGTIIKHSKISNATTLLAPNGWPLENKIMHEEQKNLSLSIDTDWWQQWQTWQNTEEILYPVQKNKSQFTSVSTKRI